MYKKINLNRKQTNLRGAEVIAAKATKKTVKMGKLN
jgi:hypothetical protein